MDVLMVINDYCNTHITRGWSAS